MKNKYEILMEAIKDSDDVTQPEGKIVSDAYKSGLLQDSVKMLYVIAKLLSKVSE